MSAWLAGLLAGWCVLRLCRVDRRWPWRVADLVPTDGSTRTTGARRPPGARSSALPRRRPPARAPHRPVRAPARRRGGPVPRDLVVVIDLLHVAVSAGHTLHTAIDQVGRAGDGPVAAALRDVARAFDQGHALVDALGELPGSLGPEVRPLVTTLVASLRSGAPLAPALQRLADAERRRARRRAEERVRRLPVLLLAPLVGLVLPAFVVLTIVPVGWTTARAGVLSASAAPAPIVEQELP